MSVKINKLQDEAIVVVSFEKHFSNAPPADQAQADRRRKPARKTADIDYVIVDLSNARPAFNDMSESLARARQGMVPMSRQARCRYILAGSDQMVRLAASALNQEQADQIEVLTASNVRDAIDYARRHSDSS